MTIKQRIMNVVLDSFIDDDLNTINRVANEVGGNKMKICYFELGNLEENGYIYNDENGKYIKNFSDKENITINKWNRKANVNVGDITLSEELINEIRKLYKEED